MLLTILLIFILINPLDVMYRKFRMEVIVTMFYIFASPFTPVRFKDFFLADIFCSIAKPLVDIYIVGCFLGGGYWQHYKGLENGII